MYVLILFAVVMTGDPSQPVYPLTRSEVQHYPSQEACEADTKKQGARFVSDMAAAELNVGLFASKCVKVTGAAGTPA